VKFSLAIVAVSLVAAAGSGFLTAKAISGSSAPARTTTVNVGTGERGPQGPPGPAGLACPANYSPGELVINHPGGQTRIWTCLHD